MLALAMIYLLAAQPAPVVAPEDPDESIQDPVLLWEEGPAITWKNGQAEESARLSPAVMTPLLLPGVSGEESLIASIDVGARLVLMSSDFEFKILSGPQSVRFSRQAGSLVKITRVAAPEGAHPDHTEIETVAGPQRWAANAFTLNLPSETPAQDEPPELGRLEILWPNSRAIRPQGQPGGPRASWRHGTASDATRCTVEVEELSSTGDTLRVQERWTGIASESLTLRAPWLAGRQYRLTVADRRTRAATETRVLSDDAVAEIDRALADVLALRDRLGTASVALETLLLETAELDSEARIRWWHLAMVTLAEGKTDRAAELFARATAVWP